MLKNTFRSLNNKVFCGDTLYIYMCAYTYMGYQFRLT